MARGALTPYQREVISLGPRMWVPFAGPDPYRCKITGAAFTPAASHSLVNAGRGRTAVTGSATDDLTGLTLTNLSGLNAVSMLLWVLRMFGAGWADGTVGFFGDQFNAATGGIMMDGRTTSTSLEWVKTSGGANFFARASSTTVPLGRWVLAGVALDLNTTSASDGTIDGYATTNSGTNNAFAAATMDASVAMRLENINLNYVRDAVLVPRLLTATEFARLGRLGPDVRP